MTRSSAKAFPNVRTDGKPSSHSNRTRPLVTSDEMTNGPSTPRKDAANDNGVLDRTRRLNEEYGLDDDEDADSRENSRHGRFGMERDDGEGHDWEGDPEDEEEAEEEEEEDGEDYDSPLATPRSKRGLVGSSTPRSSAAGSPSHRSMVATPRSRAGKSGATPTRTPRQRKPPAWMIDPSLPGFVRPTAADAYFLAASRPKRKRVEEVEQSENEGKERETLLGTPHKSSKSANRGAVVRNAEQVLTVEQRRQTLQAYHRTQYAEWRSLLLSSQNNLIFFGHGSKREMLEDFLTSTLQPLGHCISINGLYPGLKIRDVLLEIAIAFPEIEQCPVPDGFARGIDKLAHKIYAYFLPSSAIPTATTKAKAPSFKTSVKPLFLLLHNIDGPGMKNERSLEILSLFASAPGIYLVTSFDHVHTPILFSTSQNNAPKHQYQMGGWTGIPPPTRGFNWAWIQTSTYAPYTVEAEYVRQSAANSGKVLDDDLSRVHGAAGDVTEEGALRILDSVPPMAKRLFKLLTTKQLAALSSDTRSARALPAANAAFAPPFAIDSDILQTLAKDKFIAREEERYNTQLTEYKDHGVIVEHTLDAENRMGRWLWIPFSKDALTRILKTMEDVEA